MHYSCEVMLIRNKVESTEETVIKISLSFKSWNYFIMGIITTYKQNRDILNEAKEEILH